MNLRYPHTWIWLVAAFLGILVGCQPRFANGPADAQPSSVVDGPAVPVATDQEIQEQDAIVQPIPRLGVSGDLQDVQSTNDHSSESPPSKTDDPVADIQSDADDFEEFVQNSELPPIPEGFTRLDPEQEVWVNTKSKHVLLGGKICFRDGALEFFGCVRGAKEHESVVSVNALSSKLHLGLLTIGLEPGSTVQWEPEYRPASGPRIHIDVLWMEGSELRERSARDMVYNARAQRALDVDWVFGGSILYEDPETKKTYYLADGGEMISLSNFSTAALDLPIESSPDNEWLLFTALKKNIPPVGTRVLLRFSEAKRED